MSIEKESKDEDGNDLSKSRPLDLNKWSDESAFVDAIEYLLGQFKNEFARKRFRYSIYSGTMTVVIANLYSMARITNNAWIAYGRASGAYQSGRHNPAGVSAKVIREICKVFESLGYIENVMGYQERAFGKAVGGRRSRMRATESLVLLLEARFGVTLSMIGRHPDEELITLRKPKKVESPDGSTPIASIEPYDVGLMWGRVKRYNNFIRQFRIGIDLETDRLVEVNEERLRDGDKRLVDPTRTRTKRIFNDLSYWRGGRFYGPWWQNVPRQYRPLITINGKYTAEVDYSALHPSMLYALEGMKLPRKMYELEGYSQNRVTRNFLKTIALRIINATSRRAVACSIRADVQKGKLVDPGLDVNKVMDDMQAAHEPIAGYFFTGVGASLQYLDSQLAECVMMDFIGLSKPILIVHDSFIVLKEDGPYLEELMVRTFNEKLGQAIKVDYKHGRMA